MEDKADYNVGFKGGKVPPASIEELIEKAVKESFKKERAKHEKLLQDKFALVRNIEATMNLEGIVQRLIAYPEEIQNKQVEAQNLKQLEAEAKSELQFAEQMIMAQITEQTNPTTGKAMFTNDTARRAELAKRMRESAEYKEAEKAYREATNAVEAVYFDIDSLTQRFNALRIVAELTTARLNLLAGL